MKWTRNPDGRHQPLLKHEQHQVVIKKSTKLDGQCYYYCTRCQVWVAWLSKRDSARAREMELVK
jgi:hypothetical protein